MVPRGEDSMSTIEFRVTGEALWNRMERAVEKVNERLRRTVGILEAAGVPYAVVGGHAVRAWVAQVDEAALRTTKDVDILVRQKDYPALRAAMLAGGFHERETAGLFMFTDTPDGSARDAVHVVIAGEMVKAGEHAPNPDVEPSERTVDFRTVPFETLVRMKLNSFRDKDRVHLRDMISLGMIDETWLDRLPPVFRDRLKILLDDPNG
jgi:hypothetical protein